MKLDFTKSLDGLIPAIIQDFRSGRVLMLGYMNAESLQRTQESGYITFFSRSKGRLWMKGEESGNRLQFISLCTDCDHDTLLIQAEPQGPTCHTGATSCFTGGFESVLGLLERTIDDRARKADQGS